MNWKNIIFNGIFALVVFIAVMVFFERIWLTAGIIAAISVIGLVKWKSKTTTILYVGAVILGVVSEIIAVNIGVWNYPIANISGIPVWIFLVWGTLAAFTHQMGVEIQ